MSNEYLYDKAVEAVNELWSDTSVSLEKALENLENLKAEVQEKINLVKLDLGG